MATASKRALLNLYYYNYIKMSEIIQKLLQFISML